MAVKSRLTRQILPMPADISQRLNASGQLTSYAARPAYQRNDYLGWIGRAKQATTRERRIQQMLDELADGGLYMNMRWNGPRKPKSPS